MTDEHSAALFSIPQEYTLLSRTLLAEHISWETRDRQKKHAGSRKYLEFTFSSCGMHTGQY